MNIKEVKEEVRKTLKTYLEKDEMGRYRIPQVRQRPLFILGAPGIGKTAIMEQIAAEEGVALVSYTITHHTRQSAIGLPFIQEKSYGGKQYETTEYTMSEIIASIYDTMEKTGLREGILFLDEINCVSETLAPMMLQFLQEKRFGNYPVPEGFIIVTAGNPPEYNQSVREFDVATLDRIRRIDVEPDVDVFREYAYERSIHPSVLSYLEIRREDFYHMDFGAEGREFVTARGWEDLSALLTAYERNQFSVSVQVIQEYLQCREIAVRFANYLELYRKYEDSYRIDDILAGSAQDADVARLADASFDERISVVSMMLSRLQYRFEGISAENLYLKRLFGILRAYRDADRQLEDAYGNLSALLEKEENEILKKRTARLMTVLEGEAGDRLLGAFREIRKRAQGCHSYDEVMEVLRQFFQEEKDRIDQTETAADQALTDALLFLRKVSEKEDNLRGSELVYFLSELSTSYYSMDFLRQHGNQAYDECSRWMDTGAVRSDLLRRLGE